MVEVKPEHVVMGAIAVAVGYLVWKEVSKPVEAKSTTARPTKYYVMACDTYYYTVTNEPQLLPTCTPIEEYSDYATAKRRADQLNAQVPPPTLPIERRDWMLVKTDSLYACVQPTTSLIYTQVIRSNLSYDECVQLSIQYANLNITQPPTTTTSPTTTYPSTPTTTPTTQPSTTQPSPTTPKPNSPECCKSQIEYKSPWTGAIVKCILDSSGSPCGYTCTDIDGSKFGLATGCNV